MRALCLVVLLLAGAGCRAAPVTSGDRGRLKLISSKIWLAAVEDRGEHLTPAERATLRADVAIRLLAATEGRKKKDKEKPPYTIVSREADADYVLRVVIEDFDPPRPWLTLLVGFAAGRPGYDADARFERPGAPGAALASADISGRRASIEKARAGPRPAMLGEIAGAVEKFVNRHR